MSRVSFDDALAGGLGTYEFAINHSAEDDFGTTLPVTRTSGTSGVSQIRQLGALTFLPLTLKGTILTRTQLVQMYSYAGACAGVFGARRSILYTDQLGRQWEVLITDFKSQAQRVANNPRGETPDEKLVIWSYTLTMDVVRNIHGWP